MIPEAITGDLTRVLTKKAEYIRQADKPRAKAAAEAEYRVISAYMNHAENALQLLNETISFQQKQIRDLQEIKFKLEALAFSHGIFDLRFLMGATKQSLKEQAIQALQGELVFYPIALNENLLPKPENRIEATSDGHLYAGGKLII